MTLERSNGRSAVTRLLVCVSFIALVGSHAVAQDQRGWTDPPASLPANPPEPATRANPPVAAQPDAIQADPQTAPQAPKSRISPSLRVEQPTQSPEVPLRSSPSSAPRSQAAAGDDKPARPNRRQPAPSIRDATETGALRERQPHDRIARANPSFNCRFAGTLVEHTICADPVLASKDKRMALLYEQSGGSRYRPVDQRQWRWLAARESCNRAPAGALRTCISQVYDVRIAELSGAQ
jgi:hypothetical protein